MISVPGVDDERARARSLVHGMSLILAMADILLLQLGTPAASRTLKGVPSVEFIPIIEDRVQAWRAEHVSFTPSGIRAFEEFASAFVGLLSTFEHREPEQSETAALQIAVSALKEMAFHGRLVAEA